MTAPETWLPRAEAALGRRFGLEFGHLQREMRGRLVRAFARSGQSDPAAFTAALATAPDDDPLVAAVLADLTIGETSFFRNATQFDLLAQVVFPALAELSPGAPVRVWSAGCASGEEAYSLALALDGAPCLASREREVVGTDVVLARIEAARAAEYPERAVAAIPAHLRSTHLVACGRDRVRLRTERLGTRVRFLRHNLLREVPVRSLDGLALIVCRNVLIYYTDPAARRVVLDTFHERLAPGGWVLFGYAEVPMDADPRFEAAQWQGAVAYRKRARHEVTAARAPSRPPPPPPPVAPAPAPAPAEPTTFAPAELALLDQAHARATGGDLDAALRLAAAAVERAPRCAASRTLLSSLYEEREEFEQARRVVLEGLYLAPESHALRCYAAALFERHGLPLEAAELRTP